jgi:hypothetical protein
MNHRLGLIAAFAALVLVTSCDTAAPDSADLFNRFGLLEAGPDALKTDALEQRMVAIIGSAEFRAYAVFEDFESPAVAAALVAAHERGVDVRVAGDVDKRLQQGFRMLEDAGVPTQYGNGELDFELEPTRNATASGDQTRVTHNFVVVDSRQVVSVSGGFLEGRPNVYQLGFEATSEEIGHDFEDEAIQLTGGVFATTYDNFNGVVKSDVNNRRYYRTENGILEVYFGPQERLIKRVIDATYNAKASVFVVGEAFENQFLAEALRYKAMNGFEVAMVLDAASEGESPIAELLASDFDDIRGDDVLPDVRYRSDIQQNVVIIDANASPHDGKVHATKVFVLSEPLVASSGFVRVGNIYEGRTADALMDANMWALSRTPGLSEPNVDRIIGNFEKLFNAGGE